MEKKKTKLLPAIIKHRATIEGWLELMDKNTGLFARKGYKSILKEGTTSFCVVTSPYSHGKTV